MRERCWKQIAGRTTSEVAGIEPACQASGKKIFPFNPYAGGSPMHGPAAVIYEIGKCSRSFPSSTIYSSLASFVLE